MHLSSRCILGTKLENAWQGLFPTAQLWERGLMWIVSRLCGGRRGSSGTIKEKVEECEWGEGDCSRAAAGPGSCLAFVTSYFHGLTNDRQLFLGLHINNHTCLRSDPNSLCLCLLSCSLLQDCELLLLSKLGWDVYLDCDQEPVDPTPRIRLNNLNFTETSR